MRPLLLTPGDPRGVGPEISIAALRKTGIDALLLGDEAALRRYAPELQVVEEAAPGTGLRLLQLPPGDEPVEVRALRLATSLCLSGQARGLVTGPIHKARLQARGFRHTGHTDFLGELCGVPDPVMAFVGGQDPRGNPLRVALVTVHMPLRKVPDALTIPGILHTLRVTAEALRTQLRLPHPRIAVCGLNPHAGEEGILGGEEISVIGPACTLARAEGLDVWGPISAETAFIEAERSDCIVAMYHDQALVPLKALGFGRCVNWTLGLPILRTSVDHGTADHLVGTGKARPDSMIAALELADQLSRTTE